MTAAEYRREELEAVLHREKIPAVLQAKILRRSTPTRRPSAATRSPPPRRSPGRSTSCTRGDPAGVPPVRPDGVRQWLVTADLEAVTCGHRRRIFVRAGGAAVVTEIREAPRQLLWLVCEMRADWTLEETWNAIHAARTAGRDWRGIVTRLVGIALREETPQVPVSCRTTCGGSGRRRGRGRGSTRTSRRSCSPSSGRIEAHRHGTTGPQPRLTEDAERELLRGPDP